MRSTQLAAATRLSDRELLARVEALARAERSATVDLVAHLAELDKRKLHRGEGYGSLFRYCTEVLRLSEHAAYHRIVAARACRRFPMLLDRLADGALNLTTLKLIAPHLTPKNLDSVVGEASGRSRRQVEHLIARLAPKPDVPSSIRRLPAGPVDPAPPTPLAIDGWQREPAAAAQPPLTAPASASTIVAPLSPERYRVQFTVGKDTHDVLRMVQDLLRREVPDGDVSVLFDLAMRLLLEDVARKKLALTERPRKGRRPGNLRSRRPAAQIVRTVWRRDGGRCAFVARNGRRCDERAFLEFHHRHPHGLGGETSESNISLRCRAHNDYEAELVFGPGRVRSTRPGPSAEVRAPSP